MIVCRDPRTGIRFVIRDGLRVELADLKEYAREQAERAARTPKWVPPTARGKRAVWEE